MSEERSDMRYQRTRFEYHGNIVGIPVTIQTNMPFMDFDQIPGLAESLAGGLNSLYDALAIHHIPLTRITLEIER